MRCWYSADVCRRVVAAKSSALRAPFSRGPPCSDHSNQLGTIEHNWQQYASKKWVLTLIIMRKAVISSIISSLQRSRACQGKPEGLYQPWIHNNALT